MDNVALTYAEMVQIQIIAENHNLTFSQAKDVFFALQRFEQKRAERNG